MERTVITITEYCRYHEPVQPQFLQALLESGLIHPAEAPEPSIPYDELEAVERYSRLHYDLGINTEGLEAIAHMLQRMSRLQSEVRQLRERLRLYDRNGPVDEL